MDPPREMAALPGLIQLAFHRLAPTGGDAEDDEQATTSAIGRLPREMWKLILEDLVDAGDEWGFNLSQEIVKMCAVANDAPWDSDWNAACGDEGWIYDHANQILGLYRDYPNWAAFKVWLERHRNSLRDHDLEPEGGIHPVPAHLLDAPQVLPPAWWTSPKVYFKRCMSEWRFGDVDLRSYYRNPRRYYRPWSRAFMAQDLLREPYNFRQLNFDGMLYAFHRDFHDDYVYLAKIVVAASPHELARVTRSIRWTMNETTNEEVFDVVGGDGQRNATTFPEYADIAEIAVKGAGITLRYVPGSLNHDGTRTSVPPIPEYTELAMHAVKGDGFALQHVPGSLTFRQETPVADPVPGYKEIAKAAVTAYPYILQWVPGVMNVRAVAGPHTTRTSTRGVTDDDFVEIAQAAVKELATRGRETEHMLVNYIPPHLQAQVRAVLQ